MSKNSPSDADINLGTVPCNKPRCFHRNSGTTVTWTDKWQAYLLDHIPTCHSTSCPETHISAVEEQDILCTQWWEMAQIWHQKWQLSE